MFELLGVGLGIGIGISIARRILALIVEDFSDTSKKKNNDAVREAYANRDTDPAGWERMKSQLHQSGYISPDGWMIHSNDNGHHLETFDSRYIADCDWLGNRLEGE